MKQLIKFASFLAVMLMGLPMIAQIQPDLQFFRPNDKRGLNVFETPKQDTVPYDGLKVRVGGDFALQFQALSHSNDRDSLIAIGNNFNLPSANLNLDVQLHDGVRMHLRTYLSSRHHPEAWVKGGHIQFDKLDFIKKDFLADVMAVTTIRVGMDEFSYGDAVFRRSDNARAIFNPFVGNYLMDAFSTEAFGEVLVRKNGFIGLVGLTNGKLNQSVALPANANNQVSIYGKLGYDDQINDDLRLRLTGSIYTNSGTTTGQWLYGGDRAGGRYYKVMEDITLGGSDFDPRINPSFREVTAIQINPFVKFKGLEFFGVYEVVTGRTLGAVTNRGLGEGTYTQLGAELLYRFGKNENLYIGGRYNSVTGKLTAEGTARDADRVNVGAGWFMTNNVLAKVEYVNQNYTGAAWDNTRFGGGNFNGIVVEAVIAF